MTIMTEHIVPPITLMRNYVYRYWTFSFSYNVSSFFVSARYNSLAEAIADLKKKEDTYPDITDRPVQIDDGEHAEFFPIDIKDDIDCISYILKYSQ
jgi:hypothetical protein